MSKQQQEVADIQTPANARKRRFSSTNERELAPDLDEAAAERELMHAPLANGKAVRSGAFDSLKAVPEPLRVKARTSK